MFSSIAIYQAIPENAAIVMDIGRFFLISAISKLTILAYALNDDERRIEGSKTI
jgi:hypothetical protein